MFVQKTIKRTSTDGENWFRDLYINTIEELLREVGVTEIIKYLSTDKYGINLGSSDTLPNGIPSTFLSTKNFSEGGLGEDYFYDSWSSYLYANRMLYWKIDGVNYLIGTGTYGKYDYYGSSFLSQEFKANGNELDYFNANTMGTRNGIANVSDGRNWFDANTLTTITVYRDVDTKTFGIICRTTKFKYNISAGHTLVDNYSASSNDGYLTLLGKPVTTSKKDFNTREEAFRFINPVSMYGEDAFNVTDNIDQVNMKAYIQKPLIALYKYGVIGELQGVYYSTIKNPVVGELVSLGGITYIYIGGGMYFKNV